VLRLCRDEETERERRRWGGSPRVVAWWRRSDVEQRLRWTDGDADGPMSCASRRGSAWTCAREEKGGERSGLWRRGEGNKKQGMKAAPYGRRNAASRGVWTRG
jgi:hypothetical protein